MNIHIVEASLIVHLFASCHFSLLQSLTAAWLPWPPLPFEVLRWIVAWLPWPEYLEVFCPTFLFQVQPVAWLPWSQLPFDVLQWIVAWLPWPMYLEVFCPPFLFSFSLSLGCLGLSFLLTYDCRCLLTFSVSDCHLAAQFPFDVLKLMVAWLPKPSVPLSFLVSACPLAALVPFDILRWIVAWLPWPEYLEAFCLPFLFQFQPVALVPWPRLPFGVA